MSTSSSARLNISISDFEKELEDLLTNLEAQAESDDQKGEIALICLLMVVGTLACYFFAICKVMMTQRRFQMMANINSYNVSDNEEDNGIMTNPNCIFDTEQTQQVHFDVIVINTEHLDGDEVMDEETTV